jgi:hypothetical protein
MSNRTRILFVTCVFLTGVPFAAIFGNAQVKRTGYVEEFFIVAAVDTSKFQLLLKLPTEVTLLAKIDPRTQFLDEQGKAFALGEMRAGDTVWVTFAAGPNTQRVALRIRKGPMTLAELHRLYWDFPAPARK